MIENKTEIYKDFITVKITVISKKNENPCPELITIKFESDFKNGKPIMTPQEIKKYGVALASGSIKSNKFTAKREYIKN